MINKKKLTYLFLVGCFIFVNDQVMADDNNTLVCRDVENPTSGVIIERSLWYGSVMYRFDIIKTGITLRHYNCADPSTFGDGEAVADITGDILVSYKYDNICRSIDNLDSIEADGEDGFNIFINAHKTKTGRVSITSSSSDKKSYLDIKIKCE